MWGEAAGRKTDQKAIAVILMGDDVARSKAGEDEVDEEGGITRYGDSLAVGERRESQG